MDVSGRDKPAQNRNAADHENLEGPCHHHCAVPPTSPQSASPTPISSAAGSATEFLKLFDFAVRAFGAASHRPARVVILSTKGVFRIVSQHLRRPARPGTPETKG